MIVQWQATPFLRCGRIEWLGESTMKVLNSHVQAAYFKINFISVPTDLTSTCFGRGLARSKFVPSVCSTRAAAPGLTTSSNPRKSATLSRGTGPMRPATTASDLKSKQVNAHTTHSAVSQCQNSGCEKAGSLKSLNMPAMQFCTRARLSLAVASSFMNKRDTVSFKGVFALNRWSSTSRRCFKTACVVVCFCMTGSCT